MMLCGGHGVMNMIGFTSTNRVVVAQAKTARTRLMSGVSSGRCRQESEIDWTRNTS